MIDRFKGQFIRGIWKYSAFFGRFLSLGGNRGCTGAGSDDLILKEVCAIMDSLPREPGWVADVGCGKGDILYRLSAARGVHGVGLDYAGHFNQPAGPLVSFVTADCRRLSFKGKSFDFVYCYSVLQYLKMEDVRLLLQEICRILKTDGAILLGEIIRKPRYFNDHLLQAHIHPAKKLALCLYLNLFYQYYFHPRAQLEALYEELALDFQYLPQDAALPYSSNVYHALLRRRLG
jgi:ubiquinone/menaquinone biosynthesis C-methylase UbiE